MSNLPFSKKEILIIVATLILIVSIPLGVFLVKKQQTLKSRAEGGSCQSDKTNLPAEQYCLEKTLIKVFSYTENNECKLFYEPSTDSCDILNAKYTISGFVFVDTNKNGTKDVNENGVSGRTVLLTDKNRTLTHKSIQTNSEGKYKFVDIKAGEYRITHEVPEGFTRSSDDSVPIVLNENFSQHFGITQTSSISPVPSASSSISPIPSSTPALTSTPAPAPSATPIPTVVVTPTPVPSQTSEPAPTYIPEPTPTEPPPPTPTPTPAPVQSAAKQFDLNDDGWVNSFDIGIFINAWKANSTKADFNGDRRINSIDYGMLKNWMGKRVY